MQKDKLVKTLKRNSSFFKPFAFSDLARCAVKAESKRLVQSSFSTCLPAPQKKDKQACVSSRCHPSLTAFYHTLHCLSIRQKDFLQIFCISPWRDGDLVLSVLQYDWGSCTDARCASTSLPAADTIAQLSQPGERHTRACIPSSARRARGGSHLKSARRARPQAPHGNTTQPRRCTSSSLHGPHSRAQRRYPPRGHTARRGRRRLPPGPYSVRQGLSALMSCRPISGPPDGKEGLCTPDRRVGVLPAVLADAGRIAADIADLLPGFVKRGRKQPENAVRAVEQLFIGGKHRPLGLGVLPIVIAAKDCASRSISHSSLPATPTAEPSSQKARA